jgi:hypothetical protein
MNIYDMEREIQSVLRDLLVQTEGSSIEGKARAATLASDYLFEFWKRSTTGRLPVATARAKAMKAMHEKLITQEREEDLAKLEVELKEASNVFSQVEAEESKPGADGGSTEDAARVGLGTDAEENPNQSVVDSEEPEGQSVVDDGAPAGESALSARAESTPLTIFPADSPQQAEPARRGWGNSSAKGRKQGREDIKAAGVANDDVHAGMLGVPAGISDPMGLAAETLPEVQGEGMKSFRDLNDDELAQRIEQIQRSKADAMAGFGEDIKEVKNSNQPRSGGMGTPNQSVTVGRKRCSNCSFELPGYETICVACKAPQKLIIKP